MSIVIVIDTLSKMVGGGQRVLTILANALVARGFSVKVVSFGEVGPPVFALSPKIQYEILAPRFIPDEFEPLSLKNFILKFFASYFVWKSLRSTLKTFLKNEKLLVIGFGTQTATLCILATLGMKVPIIASEHKHPLSTRLFGRLIRNFLFRWVIWVAVLTEDAISYFPKYLRPKIRVIPNPVLSHRSAGDGHSYQNIKPYILGVGRLTEQKRFDLLIRAFAEVLIPTEFWNLVIAGEGPDREKLSGLIEELNLKERVKLIGNVKEISRLYSEADIFVLSSEIEGFPMALCEAMAAGLPVVAGDCPGGIRSIVRDGVDGFVVPPLDSDALAKSIEKLVADPALRKNMGKNAAEIVRRYSEEKFIDSWITMFRESIEKVGLSDETQ